jgi:hypothetical protein
MQTSSKDGGAEQRFVWFGRERDGCPDLMIPSVSASPESVTAGDRLTVNVTTQNTGSATMPATRTAFYLSRDTSQSSDDTRIGTVSVRELGPSSSELDRPTPKAQGNGSYYLLACADDKKVADEISDSNNCAASASTITVGPRNSGANPVLGTVASISTSPFAHRLGDTLNVDVDLRSAGAQARRHAQRRR